MKDGIKYKHLWIYRGNLAHTFVCRADNIILKMESKNKPEGITKEIIIKSMSDELKNNIEYSELKLPVPNVITKKLVVIDDRIVKATTYSGCSLALLSYNEELFNNIVNNIDELFNIIYAFSLKNIFMLDFNPHNVLYNTEKKEFILIDFEGASFKHNMTVREIYDNYIKRLSRWRCLKGKLKEDINYYAKFQKGGKKTKVKRRKSKGKKKKTKVKRRKSKGKRKKNQSQKQKDEKSE